MSPDTLISPDVAGTCPTCAQVACQCPLTHQWPLTREWDSAATPWSQAIAANA